MCCAPPNLRFHSTRLCRGFLTGAIRSPADLGEQDFRRVGQPRFAEEAFAKVGGWVHACMHARWAGRWEMAPLFAACPPFLEGPLAWLPSNCTTTVPQLHRNCATTVPEHGAGGAHAGCGAAQGRHRLPAGPGLGAGAGPGCGAHPRCQGWGTVRMWTVAGAAHIFACGSGAVCT